MSVRRAFSDRMNWARWSIAFAGVFALAGMVFGADASKKPSRVATQPASPVGHAADGHAADGHGSVGQGADGHGSDGHGDGHAAHGHHPDPKVHGAPPKRLAGKGTEFLYVSPPLLVWTLLVFGLTYFILSRLAWGPLLHSLEAREHKIAASVKAAEDARVLAQRLLDERHRESMKTHDEVKRVLEEARASAAKDGESLLAKAREEAAAAREQAESLIAQARAEAVGVLESQAAELAARMASKVSATKVSADQCHPYLRPLYPEARP